MKCLIPKRSVGIRNTDIQFSSVLSNHNKLINCTFVFNKLLLLFLKLYTKDHNFSKTHICNVLHINISLSAKKSQGRMINFSSYKKYHLVWFFTINYTIISFTFIMISEFQHFRFLRHVLSIVGITSGYCYLQC